MEVALPGFALGHKVLMLGARVVNDSRTVLNIPRLAVWNMDTRKGYLMYKSSPDKDYVEANGALHDLVTMSNLCSTSKDLEIRKKFIYYGLPLGVAAALIFGYSRGQGIIYGTFIGIFLAVPTALFIGFVLYWTARETRKEIAPRVWEISGSLKYEIKTEA